MIKFRDRDGHYIVQFFNLIQISIRHKCKFKYIEVDCSGITGENRRTPQLIVSLTSFPARINLVHRTINTLLRQTVKPDRVILYLADTQFPGKENDLPETLLKLKEYGLEIRWCEDLRSYKKLIPALRDFPEDIIVTADDDLYYEEKWLEKLYKAYQKDKNNIYVHRVSKLNFENGRLKTFSQRKSLFAQFPAPGYSLSIFGGSGCLYPPHTLSPEVFNMEAAQKICLNADDYWFWAMAVLKGTKVKVIDQVKSNLYIVDGTLDSAMYKTSKIDYNKVCLDLFAAYPIIKDRVYMENARLYE